MGSAADAFAAEVHLMGTKRRTPSELSKKLSRIRDALGGSQGEMVAKLGFTGKLIRERISEFELGKREPPYDVLLAYGRIAGVYVDVLIDDDLDLPNKLPASPKSPGIPRPPAPKRRTPKSDH
jgi:transcriptional regulator with XRE-family HTH domain